MSTGIEPFAQSSTEMNECPAYGIVTLYRVAYVSIWPSMGFVVVISIIELPWIIVKVKEYSAVVYTVPIEILLLLCISSVWNQ